MKLNNFKEWLTENSGYKMLAVLTAILLWFFITYQGQSQMSVEAPIEFKNVPAGLELLKQNIRKVTLSIQGHERILNWLKPTDIRLVVDLASGNRGEATYHFDASAVRTVKNIKVLRLEPNYVRVTLEESVSTMVRVKPLIIGIPRQGYSITAVTIDPDMVEIEGPKSEISRLSVVRTEPLDITGLDSEVTQNERVDAGGRNVRFKTSEVTIKVSIGRKNS